MSRACRGDLARSYAVPACYLPNILGLVASADIRLNLLPRGDTFVPARRSGDFLNGNICERRWSSSESVCSGFSFVPLLASSGVVEFWFWLDIFNQILYTIPNQTEY